MGDHKEWLLSVAGTLPQGALFGLLSTKHVCCLSFIRWEL